MEERLGRDEILRRLEIEHNRLMDTVYRLTLSQLAQPWVVGAWSVKDVLAHLVYWNVFVVQEIEAAVNEEAFEHPQGTTDEINARAVEQYRGFKPDVMVRMCDVTCGMVKTMMQNLPDDAFEPGNRIEQLLDETIHSALANNTYEHWPIHEAQIRAWLDTQD